VILASRAFFGAEGLRELDRCKEWLVEAVSADLPAKVQVSGRRAGGTPIAFTIPCEACKRAQ
jgi:hypothetical protein